MEKYCKKCGYEVNNNVNYCPNCGATLDETKTKTKNELPVEDTQPNNNRFVYRYNGGAIGTLGVGGIALFGAIESIITQVKNSQDKFWSTIDNEIITPGYRPIWLIGFIITAIIGLIVVVAALSNIRVKCKYIECPYCHKTVTIPCGAESDDCEVCGKKIIMRYGKPEKVNEE